MIEIVENSRNGCIIYQTDESYNYKYSAFYYIKKLCINHLFTYEGYIYSIKLKYKRYHQIPIVISNALWMAPTRRVRDYENVWINLNGIKSYAELSSGTKIVFMSGRSLTIQKSSTSLHEQIKFAKMIYNEKVKHFHC